MRIVTTIPHPIVKISVFQMNQKFLLKMELGAYEQTYKLAEDEVTSIDQLQDVCNEQFMKSILDRFIAMRDDFEKALTLSKNGSTTV